jgi:hypothetical protein
MKKALFTAWAVIVLCAIYPPSIFKAEPTQKCVDADTITQDSIAQLLKLQQEEATEPDEVEINYNIDASKEDSLIAYHKRLIDKRLDSAQLNIATAKKANTKAAKATQYIKENYYLHCCK